MLGFFAIVLAVASSSTSTQHVFKRHSRVDGCDVVSSPSKDREAASVSSSSKSGARAGSSTSSSSASATGSVRSSSAVSMSSSTTGSSSSSRAVSSYTDANGRTVTKVSENGKCKVSVSD